MVNDAVVKVDRVLTSMIMSFMEILIDVIRYANSQECHILNFRETRKLGQMGAYTCDKC